MTTPYTEVDDDLIDGCVTWLKSYQDVQQVLGVYDDTDTPWLFQHSLWHKVEGTQSTAAVLSYAGGWASANQHNTMRFPRVSLDIYADPLRDGAGNPTDPAEVYRRLQVVFDVFDRLLHRVRDGVVYWGTVRTLGCLRLAEPVFDYLPEGDGVRRLQCFYGVSQG